MIRNVSWRGIRLTLGVCSMALLYGCGGGTSGNGAPPTNGLNAPTATNACITTAVNAVQTGALPASDPDGQSLVFEILTLPAKGDLQTDAAGNYRYTPRTNVRGMDKLTFRARDSTGRESNIATVTFLIDGAVRIMPLGDSITLGTYTPTTPSVADESIGYRRKLYGDLAQMGGNRFGVNFIGSLSHGSSAGIGDPDHEGHGGATSNEIANGRPASSTDPGFPGVTNWLNTNPPDVILLHIGTNSFTTDPSGVTAILDRISAWESANYPVWVFIARIIQRLDGIDVTPFNDNVAAMVASRANNNRLIMVNQQTGADLVYNKTATGDMADDLHPNQSGYDKMADKWRTDLLAAGLLPSCP